jgi:hypothetical protein
MKFELCMQEGKVLRMELAISRSRRRNASFPSSTDTRIYLLYTFQNICINSDQIQKILNNLQIIREQKAELVDMHLSAEEKWHDYRPVLPLRDSDFL